ncbi:MAG: hypothetical protein HOC20_11320 [Chloroflexi bacterium]|jgi:hypothetical protein|nr:hypothetical protein [Chloroflexota bacterium]
MTEQTYCSLHPFENRLPAVFYYGNMQVTRKTIVRDSTHGKRMVSVFESYLKAGILPQGTYLLGDYVEHVLRKSNDDTGASAGRYLGLVLPTGNYQYVRIEGESIGVEKRKLDPPDEINILTDTCLFCAANATATLDSGEELSIVAPTTKIDGHIEKLCISDKLCPYEMDAVARLTDLIVAMKEGNRAFKKVIMAMPTVEYYFYLMEAYNNGFVEKEMMREWIGQVNRHAEKIIAAIRKRIGLPVEICQPLGSVEPYIKDRVDRGKPADFEEVKRILSAVTRLWQEVLPITNPKDWKDLNYTNYAIAVLESSMIDGNNNRLVIDIENPSEQRILRNAAKIARELGKRGSEDSFRVIGIYPHEKVFIPQGGQCSEAFPRLYYLEQPQVDGECLYRAIIEENKRKVAVKPYT